MHLVVVSAPGSGAAPHWSHAFAGELAAAARARGAAVDWLAAVPAGQPAPTGEVAPRVFSKGARPLPYVTANHADAPIELELTRCLRRAPHAAVVHVGVGAQGSLNVLWLSSRLGSRVFACARGHELVCARGDLVDRDGRPCSSHDDPARCRWCCRTSWRRRPHQSELQNRTDLVVAGLLVAERVFVAAAAEVALVTGLDVKPARVEVCTDAAVVVDRVWAGTDASAG